MFIAIHWEKKSKKFIENKCTPFCSFHVLLIEELCNLANKRARQQKELHDLAIGRITDDNVQVQNRIYE